MPRPAIWLLAVWAAACHLPRDAAGTLDRVRGGVLAVGVIHNPPFVIDSGGEVRGVEAALVIRLTQELGSTVRWVRKPEHELMRALRHRELDLVIGGLDDTVPWKTEVALTRPDDEDATRHVLAAPPGENAWLVRVEALLRSQESSVGRLVAEATQ